MQARNADMWLIQGTDAVHIHHLCDDQRHYKGEQLGRPPGSVTSAMSLTLSPCGQQMARLAAQAGRFQDQIATLSTTRTLSPHQRFGRGNTIAAEIEEDLFDMQNRFTLEALPPQHSLLVSIGLARVRRDVAILLCGSLQLNLDDAKDWESSARQLHHRRLDLDRALIQCAVDHSGRVMLSKLGEPFFTNFICDSVMALAGSLQQEGIEQDYVCRDTTLQVLKSATVGRNLLVAIAKQSELAENHRLAARASQLLASVVEQMCSVSDTAMSLSTDILDMSRVVSLDACLSVAVSFLAKETVFPDVENAEGWLDWIAAYPALQQIFDLPPSCIDPVQTLNNTTPFDSFGGESYS
ncbi:hypothetical protein CBS101457_002976 [Exobasidium rhododendri]|nr:hypothetical protein CBS101457_002976 [Exobasidium rhododendri]